MSIDHRIALRILYSVVLKSENRFEESLRVFKRYIEGFIIGLSEASLYRFDIFFNLFCLV